MNIKKLLSASLAILMLVALIACTKPGNGTENSGETLAPIVDESDDRLSASDGIEAVSFAGEQYKISVADNQQFEVFSEDTQDVVDAAVYDRNMRIEDKYEIEFVPVITTGYSSGAGQLLHEQEVKKSLDANDYTFDTVLMCAWRAGTLITEGYFYNWNDDVPGVNFEQPWWNQRCNEAFTVNDMLFAAVGDISLTTLAMAHGYLYNKSMAADLQIEDLYQVVRDDKWTIDYVKQITQNIYTDVNKDNIRDSGDEYGFASGVVTNLDAYLPSFGISLVTAENDELVVSIDTDRDRVQTAFEKVMSLFYDSTGSYISMTHAEYSDRYTMFANGQVLLTDGTVNVLANQCRDMTDDYGVLPYPKYDEAQENYYSNAHDNFSVLCMAYNVQNLEMVGKVTESLCCESYRTVIPAYYDTALKDKFTDTDDDEEMLDIIMEGRNYDLAVLFAPTLNRLFYFFRDVIANQSSSVIGDLDANYFSWTAALIKLQEIYMDMAVGA